MSSVNTYAKLSSDKLHFRTIWQTALRKTRKPNVNPWNKHIRFTLFLIDPTGDAVSVTCVLSSTPGKKSACLFTQRVTKIHNGFSN